MALDFGGEEHNLFSSPSPNNDGTLTIGLPDHPYSFSNIAQYTSSFAAGYEQCAENLYAQGGYLPDAKIDIVVSNDLLENPVGTVGSTIISSSYQTDDYNLGYELISQALNQTLNGYAYLTKGVAPEGIVTFGIGDDIEPGYSSFIAADSWFQGVQAGFAAMNMIQTAPDFFGASDGCILSGCSNSAGWTSLGLEELSLSGEMISLPQIYYPGDATGWAQLSQQAINTADYNSLNAGITSEAYPIGISADSAWSFYWQQLNDLTALFPSNYSGLEYITDFCNIINGGVCQTPSGYCSLYPEYTNCLSYLSIVTIVENADPPGNVFASSTLPLKAPKMVSPSVYVSDLSNGTIEEVDTTTGAVQPLAIANHGSITSLEQIISNEFIAIDTTNNQALIIKNGTEIKSIPVGSKPTEAAVGSYHKHRYALVTDTGADEVTPIDLNSLTALPPIKVGSTPLGIAISRQNQIAYVCDSGSDEITPINLKTLTAESPITNIRTPADISVTNNGKLALVTNFGSNQVTPIDLKNMQVLPGIVVGLHPMGIAISRNDRFAYVANFGSSSVTQINLKQLTATANLNISGNPISVSINNNKTIYVTLFSSSSLAEFKQSHKNTLTLSKILHVGPEPLGLAVVNNKNNRKVT